MSEYPEHERLVLVARDSQVQGEFVDWAIEKGFLQIGPAGSLLTALAEYHGIDPEKIEAEKRQMLNEIAGVPG